MPMTELHEVTRCPSTLHEDPAVLIPMNEGWELKHRFRELLESSVLQVTFIQKIILLIPSLGNPHLIILATKRG